MCIYVTKSIIAIQYYVNNNITRKFEISKRNPIIRNDNVRTFME